MMCEVLSLWLTFIETWHWRRVMISLYILYFFCHSFLVLSLISGFACAAIIFAGYVE